jgi:hypothetical protein
MAYNSPFRPHGKTLTLQTNVVASTPTVPYLIKPSDFGLNQGEQYPSQLRIINNGTADIFINVGNRSDIDTAAFPTPTAGAAGTGQYGWRIKPNAIEVFSINVGPTMYISDVSASASQQYDLTPGEGS